MEECGNYCRKKAIGKAFEIRDTLSKNLKE